VGSTAPDFELADAEGKSYRLSELLTDGPVVLVFLRGFG
jgi:peroxiredoxin